MKSNTLIESQFIVKITDMMKEHPDIINWNDNGTQLHLPNIDVFCQKLLPQYFRHSNFNSFIRQLNIYNFHKTKKIGKCMSFKNQIFRKGNQNNFFQIQRKRKFKQLQNFQQRFQKECKDLIQSINQKNQITSSTKQTIINLFQYKYISYVNIKRMKCQLDALYKDLKDSRNQKIQQICQQFKSQYLTAINQLMIQNKKIDQFIAQKLICKKQSVQTKQNLQQIPNQKLFNRQLQNSLNINQISNKSKSVIKEDSSDKEKHISEEIKQNIHAYNSYNSFNVFLEQYKTKKQQFTYDHKLYNPFNSHNSFMFLPNYIGGPSQIPQYGKYNQFHNKFNQSFQQQSNPNIVFDDYDQSASISFVKNLNGQDQLNFSSTH